MNRQKVQKASEVWNICKGHRFGGTFTKALIFHQLNIKKLELPLELWYFFRLFLLDPRASSIPVLKWLPTRQSEWSCWCSIAFFPRRARIIFKSFTSYNQRSLCTKVCLQNARPFCSHFFYSGYALRKKTFQPRIDRLGGCWGSCIMMRALQTEKTKKLVVRKCYEDLQLLLMSILGWKDLPIRKTQVKIQAELPISTN